MDKLDPKNAELLMQIYDLRREERLRRAREWVLAQFWAQNLEEFNAICAPGTDGNAFYRQATTYWEMVALIVNRGMIDEELYFESTAESLYTWLRVKSVVYEFRRIRKNPTLLRNLEKLSERHEQWFAAQAPDAVATTMKMFEASRNKARGTA